MLGHIERPDPAAVIVAALREDQPFLGLPTARRRTERILQRLREAGYEVAPLVPVGWPKD